ncbi:MAG: hypothetical protein Q8M76_06685, partial [Spirochaetaceae bacterium]|nr:hypothetical protein [Spirochaetaceae bacterium]
ALAAPAGLGAQEQEIIIDEAALFGDEEAGIEELPESQAGSAVSTFLKTEAVRIGGRFSGSVGADWTMLDPWGGSPSLDERSFDATAGGDLFFDARPSEDFRVYGKAKTSYPFTKTQTVDTSTVSTPNIQVFELFSDFTWNDGLFLRFGKHTVKWGVGYFWSPADVINLGRIDPLDPEAQREGPLSLRLHYPVLGTQTNLWAYAVLPSGSDPKPEEVAGAAKLEFLVADSWEIGLGGYYKYESPPKAVLTATGAIGEVNLFAEGVAGWGRDRKLVTAINFPAMDILTTEQEEEGLFFSGTAGFSWSDSDSHLSLVGQYYYEANSYSDEDRKELIERARFLEPALTASIGSTATKGLFKGLVAGSGQHYAAASLSKSELFVDDLSFSVFAMANLSDLSGTVRPSLNYKLFDKASLELSAAFAFGDEDGEYVVLADGTALTLGLKASLGSGSF